MPRVNVIDKIVRADLCTGCGACAAFAPDRIEMGFCDEGFLRPNVTDALNRKMTGDLLRLCPGQHQVGFGPGRRCDPLWGRYEAVHEGWAKDPKLRHAGASGGALSAMLAWLVETGQVDGVLSVAEAAETPLANETVLSTSREGIIAQAASRYAPSKPLERVTSLLKHGGRFAFVGKPCDVAGLRNWAKLDPLIDERFPIKLSFFCAGVPSIQGAERLSRAMGVAPDDLRSFRYRGRGWPGRTVAVTKAGEEASMTYAESWGGILSKHVQPRCRICADGIGLAADIAFADAWQTDRAGYPLFEEGEGRSLIVSRSAVGQQLLQRAVEAGAIEAEHGSIDRVAPMQPGQVRRRQELLGRLAGRILAGYPIPRYRGLAIWGNARSFGAWPTLRAALGMARRCLIRKRMAQEP
jgi:coenzyme F420 hydrogenase subunit beta